MQTRGVNSLQKTIYSRRSSVVSLIFFFFFCFSFALELLERLRYGQLISIMNTIYWRYGDQNVTDCKCGDMSMEMSQTRIIVYVRQDRETIR